MKKYSILILFLLPLFFMQSACKKKTDTEVKPLYLQVDLPRHELKHKLYYSIPYEERSIELAFDNELDPRTVEGNIRLEDINGDLSQYIGLHHTANQVLITLHPGFDFKPGWKYNIILLPGLRSLNGLSPSGEKPIECRTSIAHAIQPRGILYGGGQERTAIAVISDIHMGDTRANNNKYCWFGKNRAAMEAFLDYVLDSSNIKQLVILGDLFDEWLVPYTISPFDSAVNITNTREFFVAVAGSEMNEDIFEKLNHIANDDRVELIYVPGNHDMLGTQEILNDIIPKAQWEGGPDGLGQYLPFTDMIFEHGHRYDFFNCPQPLVNEGQKLPPGYFVSRLYAKGMMDAAIADKSVGRATGSFEFIAAWDIAFLYTIAHFRMDLPDVYAENILMGGIDGYTEPVSFHGTKEMYAAGIEDYWPATQAQNQVPVPTPCCFHAIWNGHSDLFSAAEQQYMMQPPAPQAYKIVAFGHTHEPMLEYYDKSGKHSSIYANSGSWIDADQSSYKVRTYLLITPKAWTGSELDVVGLYQYNPDTGDEYKPVLIKEESVK
ncbi:MAG: metallophosphoesterase [Bacteroidales bacterium]|nr:metallophosphoesterase [Bacteroidales bacterium]